ncbi:hypothetical protein JTB14_003560 [Gonioctena quinquepunctata]|nr:hypothetical protein JTB14_003560 [Gonioctena quinquepunctata]
MPILPKPPTRPINEEKENTPPINESVAAIAPDVCCCCPAHKQIVQTGTIDMNKIKKQYLFMTNIMADIKSEQSEIKAVVVSAQQHPIPPLNESIFKKISLPINDDGALEVLEEYLRSEANFQKAIPEISNMGGNSIYDFVKRSLIILITNKFANKFSFLGKKQKASFNKLKICELVINAAEHSRVSCSRKEAEESISKWLRRANERKGV